MFLVFMMGEVFCLTGRENGLYFEKDKSSLVVLAIQEGIKLGHILPASSIFRMNDEMFLLDGNHTALANIGLALPFECEEYVSKDRRFSDSFVRCLSESVFDYCLIGDVQLRYSGVVGEREKDRLKDSLSCLPVNVVQKFCIEHGLESKCYLPQ